VQHINIMVNVYNFIFAVIDSTARYEYVGVTSIRDFFALEISKESHRLIASNDGMQLRPEQKP